LSPHRERGLGRPQRARTPPEWQGRSGPRSHQFAGYEIEVIPGIEELALEELGARFGEDVQVTGLPSPGRIAVAYRGPPRRLNQLRTAASVHAVEAFMVPRPRALLGHEQLSRLLRSLERIVALDPGAFRTLRLSAAGAESAVFERLRAEVAHHLGLTPTDRPGDLQLAFRRPPDRSSGWQMLVRLGPRPLSARPWRVCDMPGALNATVASAMVRLAQPPPEERFLNLACGSATLLVERLAIGPAKLAVGVDADRRALACARANLRASGRARAEAVLLQADAARLPIASGTVDTLVADLPFGMLVGARADNRRLYPALLAEATRVAAPSATLVIITAERKLFEATLARFQAEWVLGRVFPLQVPYRSGYIAPAIYHLRRGLVSR
jgi:tRNA (guanine6-N2)-methyltransferase